MISYIEAYTMVKRGAAVSGHRQYEPMYRQIIQAVQSSGRHNAVGDQGQAVGLYQMHPSYWSDYNKLNGTNYSLEDRKNPELARKVFDYMDARYCRLYAEKHGVYPSFLQRASWHNGGFNNSKAIKNSTLDYVRNVANRFRKLTNNAYSGMGGQQQYTIGGRIGDYVIKAGDTPDLLYKRQTKDGILGLDTYMDELAMNNPGVAMPRTVQQEQALAKELGIPYQLWPRSTKAARNIAARFGVPYQKIKPIYWQPGQKIRVRMPVGR